MQVSRPLTTMRMSTGNCASRNSHTTNDMWIAALVLEHSLVLCARDAHFDALAQITRI